MSMDVRRHDCFDNRCLLLPWELKHAEKVDHKFPYLKKTCPCHIETRLKYKYFLMGLHFISLFLVMSGNTLIATHIVKYITLTDLAMVAIYLPASARRVLAHSKTQLKEMVFCHNSHHAPHINIERLQHQLCDSRFGLLNELIALEPYTSSELIDTLDFLDYNLKDSCFNPVFPIICIVTSMINMLYIYRYGKTGRYARTIIYSSTFTPKDKIQCMSWSSNGLLLYIVTKSYQDKCSLHIFRFNERKYKMSLVTQLPFVERLISNYLWFNNNSLLYSSPDKSDYHLCKLIIGNGNVIQKQPIGNITDDSRFECLKNFSKLDPPILVSGIPDKIFFTGTIRCYNVEKGKYTYQYCLVQLSIFDLNQITLYHLPGPSFNIATNGRFLVFTYEAPSKLESVIHTHTLLPDQDHIACLINHHPVRDYELLVVGILDVDLKLDYRFLNRE